MFLKLCNPTLFINLSAEATQLPTTGNLQTYEASGFRTIEYFPQNSKQVKGTLSTSVKDQMLNCSHVVAWRYFFIIGRVKPLLIGNLRKHFYQKRTSLLKSEQILTRAIFILAI